MNDNEKLKQILRKNLDVRASNRTYNNMLDTVLEAQESIKKTNSAATPTIAGRFTMRKPMIRFALAAAIIAAVVLGLFEFIDTGSASGVVWAEVAQKVQASGGLIVRCTESTTSSSDDTDYAIKYFCPTHSRTDYYENEQITHAYYDNYEAMTFTAVYHTRKHYLSTQFTGTSEGFLEKQDDWMNPRYLVQKILSCEHRKLEQETIEGVLCEGLETTDAAVMGPLPGPVDRLEVQMRLWVNAETEYPLRFEYEITIEAEGQVLGSEGVMDQFQWNVELDPNLFEPNIPPDYVSMSDL